MNQLTTPGAPRLKLELGDWVVYPLSPAEQGLLAHPSSASRAYKPLMSLPSKVVQVKNNQVTVATIGAPKYKRTVSMSVCRKLTTEIPATLQKLAIEVIEFDGPKRLTPIMVKGESQEKLETTWDELNKSVTIGPREKRSKKRSNRPSDTPLADAVEAARKSQEEKLA